jgi:hypothetical protein
MAMNALRLGSVNREWFVDPRGPDRRMQATRHSDAQRIVLSIWRGDTCTATFQLPIEDAPRLIGHLADCLSAGITRDADRLPFDGSTPLSAAGRVRAALERTKRRFRR